jgi:hypothetical protein
MKTPISLLVLAVATLLAASTQAQQSPSPQPTQPQAQTAPCNNTPNPANQVDGPTFKTPNKWKQMLDKQRQQIANSTGIAVPDPTKPVEQATKAKPAAPCPVKPAATPPASVAPKPAMITLPPDAFITLRCDPTVPDPSGRSHEPSLAWDPADFAVPKANEVEVDFVVHNTTAKTPCYVIKTDPNTLKSYIPK